MPPTPSGDAGRARTRLWLFFLANYAALVWVCADFLPRGGSEAPPGEAFLVAVALSYPALYLAPALLLSLGLARLAARRAPWLPGPAAVGLFALTQLFFYADRRVHAIFGFHLNGFVWNLLTTPGGFESMGAGPEAVLAAGAIAVAVIAAEGLLLSALGRRRSQRAARGLCSRVFATAFVAALLLLSVAERLAFGVAGIVDYGPVLQQAGAFPFYQPLSIEGLARHLGYVPRRGAVAELGVAGSRLAYPLHPVVIPAEAAHPNFLVLCAESLRADMLDPEIMPATWAYAARSSRFTRHLSGGNGTRMGVFGLFYGLPGSYWFEFLRRQQGPVLLDALASAGYRVEAFTSDKFSYPEFDQTVFASLPRAQLHAALAKRGPKRASWERDREGVSKLLRFLARRDPAQPFFAYFFFESPHARYEFPPESVIRRPYLESFDYVTADLERDMPLIRNRYVNSVHHLDSQIARVLAYLDESGLAANTVVVVTGDHGEEFMEQGRWGHNSAFSEEQIRVPLVVHVPGRAPERIDRATSHLDVPATLLELAGAENPASDFAFGSSLFATGGRPYQLVADWSRVVYVDDEGKASFPMHLSAFFRQDVTDRSDRPLADPDPFLKQRLGTFREILAELGRFHREAPGPSKSIAKVERGAPPIR